MSKRFFVYIVANGQRRHVLYIGVSGNLIRRVFEHKSGIITGFTSRYNLTRLVYYETFVIPMPRLRARSLKGWLRSRKIKLIESVNPNWHDLAERWYDLYKPPTSCQSTPDPSLRLKSGCAQDDAITRY